MRILVDARHFSDARRTGVGEYTDALLRALFDMGGDEYELLTSGRAVPTLPFVASRTHVPLPNKLFKLSAYTLNRPRLDRLAMKKPDLVWLPNLNFSPVSPSVPYVLTIHDLSFRLFPEFFSAKMRLWHRGTRPERLVANAAAILVPSRATKEDVVRWYGKPPESIHIVPHGADPMFSPNPSPADHGVRGKYKLPSRFAFFVGTLEPRKNVERIADAMASYRRASGDDTHLVLAGGWGWKSGSIRTRVLPPADGTSRRDHWIHVLGYVPRADLPALYRAAACFVWPSVYEGFGLPVLDALSSGTPVITSHTSSLPELVGDAAVLVNPFRTEEIAQALGETLSSPVLRAGLREAGLARATQFSWTESARATRAAFEAATHR